MGIKINVGLSKKIGQPDFGSLGATCNVEFELDGRLENGHTGHFQDAVRRAYGACRLAVEAEIASGRSGGIANVAGGQYSNSQAPVDEGAGQTANGLSPTNGNLRIATSSQVRAIHAIAKRNGIDLRRLLRSEFGVGRPDDLLIRDASALIDQLKGSSNEKPHAMTR